MTRYRIYGVDRAGETGEVHEYESSNSSAFYVLWLLKRLRAKALPYDKYFVVDADNEDYGDMEARLQELADGG